MGLINILDDKKSCLGYVTLHQGYHHEAAPSWPEHTSPGVSAPATCCVPSPSSPLHTSPVDSSHTQRDILQQDSTVLPRVSVHLLAVFPVSHLHYTLHLLTVHTHKKIFYNKIAQSFPQFLLQQLAVFPISHIHYTLHLLTVHTQTHTHIL